MPDLLDPARETGARGTMLESWGTIAAYLGRGVTTVQRWEHKEGLPIHRLSHTKKGSVFAFTKELDHWRGSRARAPRISDTFPPLLPSPPLRAPAPAVVPEPQAMARPAISARFVAVLVALTITVLASIAFVTAAVLGRPWRTGESFVNPQPLANDPAPETAPSLSPDGTQVVYGWNRDGTVRLYVKAVAGGSPHRLMVDDPRFSHTWSAKWSPDGTSIAFIGVEPTSRGLYVVKPSGGPAQRLTSVAGVGVSWRPGTPWL